MSTSDWPVCQGAVDVCQGTVCTTVALAAAWLKPEKAVQPDGQPLCYVALVQHWFRTAGSCVGCWFAAGTEKWCSCAAASVYMWLCKRCSAALHHIGHGICDTHSIMCCTQMRRIASPALLTACQTILPLHVAQSKEEAVCQCSSLTAVTTREDMRCNILPCTLQVLQAINPRQPTADTSALKHAKSRACLLGPRGYAMQGSDCIPFCKPACVHGVNLPATGLAIKSAAARSNITYIPAGAVLRVGMTVARQLRHLQGVR